MESLRKVVNATARKQTLLGQDAVELEWVKAHMGIGGNERADRLAKEGSS